MGYEDDVIFGMNRYFSSYRERFPHKGIEDAIRATKNWAEGLIKSFRRARGHGDFIDSTTLERIERRVDELRVKGL